MLLKGSHTLSEAGAATRYFAQHFQTLTAHMGSWFSKKKKASGGSRRELSSLLEGGSALKATFQDLVSARHSLCITQHTFEAYFNLPILTDFGHQLFFYINAAHKDYLLLYEDFELLYASVSRATTREILLDLFQVTWHKNAQAHADYIFTACYIMLLVTNGMECTEKGIKFNPRAFSSSLLSDSYPVSGLHFDHFYDWVTYNMPHLHLCFSNFIRFKCQSENRDEMSLDSSYVPLCLPQLSEDTTIPLETVFGVTLALHHLHPEWHCIYNSQKHGLSFHAMTEKALLGYSGSTLLVVRTQEGQLLAGYAAQQWEAISRCPPNRPLTASHDFLLVIHSLAFFFEPQL